jgi:hypothetical protein
MIQRSRFDTVKVELGVRMEIKVEVLQRFDDLVEIVQNLFRLPRSFAGLIAMVVLDMRPSQMFALQVKRQAGSRLIPASANIELHRSSDDASYDEPSN